MKSIISIAALVAIAGSAAAQLDMAHPIQTGQPIMGTDGVTKVHHKAYVDASTQAGLDGNLYSLTHAVVDIFVAQFMADNAASVFLSAGQATPFPLNFTAAGAGSANIYYDDAHAAWADTTVVPAIVPPLDPTLLTLNMDSDVEAIAGTHEIIIRAWFASDGASVFPFSQPSLAGSPSYTPTILGTNNGLPEGDRHPVGVGGDIGDAVNGFGGIGLAPPAGMVWDQAGANIVTDWVLLGFRQLDGAFVGVTFGLVPDISFNGADELVVDFLALQPATLNFNPDTGLEDFSVGGGPIAWGDGLTDSYNAFALQYEFIATAIVGGTPCPADLADGFGSPAPDGVVDFGDFLFLLGAAGPCPGGVPGCAGDIADGFGTAGADGAVDFGDFLFMLGQAGPCP